ncbi:MULTISPECIES: cytochrome o ubiquinol oxidase subunit IV [Paenibacillus]|uniref:cytochrome o ubiquinol oxidase subunit IV n=1 Tax=Paenibacillus TaxID=44249 RepID=UPI0007BEAD35|nr:MULTISPECIES: cytochrome o ubiquinol oxidase subunit IV [Paenibacillus]WDQ32928.1 cytochrome o ubiquinol oxidase subunit IV [Paenibacillus marchantiae]SDM08607.1 cytochrome o ubiquinol oxidase operon protein cyoD [Paenibacillus sp. OK060]SEB27834.1 cytochrome o ubiquinol oxidase operon protein cyoD [Paenibacillus sp. 276b]SEL44877.1 cytochrome o ubiquinol oxidase operon protein cyoD [Paenibacillus sp. OK003]SHN84297.1 cytochrome o ubiquinol oxidase operon protein cyoD [Paenibacillus sp. ov0
MAEHNSHESHGHEQHGSLKSYVIGFILSVVLTIVPLVVVLNDMMGRTATLSVVLVTAALQFVVQLFFFMHIRESEKPRWNVMALIFGLLIMMTIVIGSIWIMLNNTVAH